MAVDRVMKEMEAIDRDKLFVCDPREIRGHGKNPMKTRCLRNIQKHSCPNISIDTWNDGLCKFLG